jgi:hypothetical protein
MSIPNYIDFFESVTGAAPMQCAWYRCACHTPSVVRDYRDPVKR